MGNNPYDNIYAWLWDLLQETEATLPYGSLNPYILSAINGLLAVYPGLGSYAGLQGTDLSFFEEGVALLVAVRVRPARVKRVQTGDVSQIKQGPVEYSYAPGRVPKGSLEEQWQESARLALRRVSAIHAVIAARAASFSPFVIAGPTRASEAAGNVTTLLSSVIRSLSESGADELETRENEGEDGAEEF